MQFAAASRVMKAFDGPTLNEAAADSSASAPPTRSTVSLRTDFSTTPLFIGAQLVPQRYEILISFTLIAVSANGSGKTDVSFTLPDNIGTFEIRVYAINSNNQFGGNTTDIISRRPLSLQSAAPRIVRSGDDFLTGVTVTLHEFDSAPVEVTVEVRWVCELLTLRGASLQTVSLSGPGPHLVNFRFEAIGTGTAYLLYSATVNDNLEDAALYTQEIKGQQEPVSIATSFAVSESEESEQGFGLPESVAYSGALRVDAGVGRLPSVLTLANLAFEAVSRDTPSSMDWLASMVQLDTLNLSNLSTVSPICAFAVWNL